jgi:hypothetical protein
VKAFVNIALGKPTTQSSLSHWSSDCGAQGLVNGTFEQNYGIHTELQDRPWAQVDLLNSFPLETIVVHNRRDSFQERASRLMVEISLDDFEWIIVHTGFCCFGSKNNGQPLTIPLASTICARYVRLSLPEQAYLHLSQLEILVDARIRIPPHAPCGGILSQ